jgi:uncharacterized transporter YbjL
MARTMPTILYTSSPNPYNFFARDNITIFGNVVVTGNVSSHTLQLTTGIYAVFVTSTNALGEGPWQLVPAVADKRRTTVFSVGWIIAIAFSVLILGLSIIGFICFARGMCKRNELDTTRKRMPFQSIELPEIKDEINLWNAQGVKVNLEVEEY